MTLAVPLSLEQIDVANSLHARSERWRHVDQALDQLRDALPGFRPEITLVKAVAINALYGTNVLAISRVAEHVTEVLEHTDVATAEPALVEELAAVPQGGGEQRPRRRHSFASKFAHFFIEPVRFPIFDRYAADMVRLHLGQARAIQDPERPYFAFVANVETLERTIGFRGSRRELDRYL
jgi:hypothetical protein